MILLSLSDFVGGKYNIADASNNQIKANVTECINLYETDYIQRLLGVTLGNSIIAYLAASRLPNNANYNTIIDAFSLDGSCGISRSSGIKEFLTAAIFYEYTRDTTLRNTVAGVVKPEAETAVTQGPASITRYAESKFNSVLDTVYAIQKYCMDNQAAFSTFKGEKITVKRSNIL